MDPLWSFHRSCLAAQGTVSVSVNWGAWAGSGMAAAAGIARMERLGFGAISPAGGAAALGAVLRLLHSAANATPQLTGAVFLWDRYGCTYHGIVAWRCKHHTFCCAVTFREPRVAESANGAVSQSVHLCMMSTSCSGAAGHLHQQVVLCELTLFACLSGSESFSSSLRHTKVEGAD